MTRARRDRNQDANNLLFQSHYIQIELSRLAIYTWWNDKIVTKWSISGWVYFCYECQRSDSVADPVGSRVQSWRVQVRHGLPTAARGEAIWVMRCPFNLQVKPSLTSFPLLLEGRKEKRIC